MDGCKEKVVIIQAQPRVSARDSAGHGSRGARVALFDIGGKRSECGMSEIGKGFSEPDNEVKALRVDITRKGHRSPSFEHGPR